MKIRAQSFATRQYPTPFERFNTQWIESTMKERGPGMSTSANVAEVSSTGSSTVGRIGGDVPRRAGSRTFVLAHGSWLGGWCWQRVALRLRERGHLVFTPSYTGMGDRAHLLSHAITIDTFVADLVNVIESNELDDVILVGHSFGGVPISGVADKIPGLLRHMVYLDAVVLESGKHAFSIYPSEEAAARVEAAERATSGLAVPVPTPLPVVWGLTPATEDYRWVTRRLTPQPLRSYTTALTLHAPIGNGIPKTYVECKSPAHPVLSETKRLIATQGGWRHMHLAAPHNAMITDPELVTEILLKIS